MLFVSFFYLITLVYCRLEFVVQHGKIPIQTHNNSPYIQLNVSQFLKLDCRCFACNEDVHLNYWQFESVYDGLVNLPTDKVVFDTSTNSPVSSLKMTTKSEESGKYVCSTQRRVVDSISVYVFIKDENFFSPLENRTILISKDHAIVPCRANRFDLNVTLRIDDRPVNVDYNPMIGFRFNKKHLDKSKVITCEHSIEKMSFPVSRNNTKQELVCPNVGVQWHQTSTGSYLVNCTSEQLDPRLSLVTKLRKNYETPNDVLHTSHNDGSLEVLSTTSVDRVNVSCRCYQDDFLKSERTFREVIRPVQTGIRLYGLVGVVILMSVAGFVVKKVILNESEPITNEDERMRIMILDEGQCMVFNDQPGINNGSHSVVYVGKLFTITRNDEIVVAVKQPKTPEPCHSVENEALILSKLPLHHNLVEIFGFVKENNIISKIVMMKYDNKCLYEYLKKIRVEKTEQGYMFKVEETGRSRSQTPPPSSYDLASFVYQILKAIRCIHAENIAHGDITTRNILLDCYHRCRLADFGVAQVTQDNKCFLKDVEMFRITALEIFRLSTATYFCSKKVLDSLTDGIPQSDSRGSEQMDLIEEAIKEYMEQKNPAGFAGLLELYTEPIDEDYLEKFRRHYIRSAYGRVSALPGFPNFQRQEQVPTERVSLLSSHQ